MKRRKKEEGKRRREKKGRRKNASLGIESNPGDFVVAIGQALAIEP